MVKHRQPAWSPPQRIQGGATRKSLGVQTRHDLGKYRAGRWHLPSYQKAKSKSLTPPNAANTLLSLDTALLPTTLNWTAVSQTISEWSPGPAGSYVLAVPKYVTM